MQQIKKQDEDYTFKSNQREDSDNGINWIKIKNLLVFNFNILKEFNHSSNKKELTPKERLLLKKLQKADQEAAIMGY